jgi:hypothetical protein
MAILDMAENLIGEDVHGKVEGASCRAFLALKTVLNFFAADFEYFRQQGTVGFGYHTLLRLMYLHNNTRI